jgi:hypothetical protein
MPSGRARDAARETPRAPAAVRRPFRDAPPATATRRGPSAQFRAPAAWSSLAATATVRIGDRTGDETAFEGSAFHLAARAPAAAATKPARMALRRALAGARILGSWKVRAEDSWPPHPGGVVQ